MFMVVYLNLFRRDDRPIEQIYHLSQRGIRFLQGLYTDNDALKSNRASMVYICAIAMNFLFQPEGRDDRMLQGFFKYGLRRDLCIPDTMSNEDCQQYVMDYFKVIYHYNMTYHTRYSVLESYAIWFNGGRESYMAALAKTKHEAILKDSMCDIHCGILPDNFREYHFSQTYPLQAAKPTSTFPYDPFVHSVAFNPLIVDCPSANQLAIDLLVRDQASFYHQTIMDLDALTEILHPQKQCCASISIESYSPRKYSQARQHLDDKIALLQWIVGQFITVPCTYHNRHLDILMKISSHEHTT